MKAPVNATAIVQDVLGLHPGIIQVFFRNHMDCVGCSMQRFCTLEDAALSYSLSLNDLLEEFLQEIPLDQRREE